MEVIIHHEGTKSTKVTKHNLEAEKFEAELQAPFVTFVSFVPSW